VDWASRGVPAAVFAGGIALSGLFDLDPIRQCEMNDVLGLTDEDVRAWSPTRVRPTVDAPLVLVDGARESDEFHRQMQVLAGAPGWDARVAATVSLPDRHHFDLLEDFLDVQSPVWQPLSP
jgi:arylformamidase